MSQEEFLSCKEHYAKQIEDIRLAAHELHQSVNDTFGSDLPYGFHLDMVVENISCYGHIVCPSEDDVLPLFFGGYFHDSIENARLTYNDVLKTARQWLTEEQALMATEIVYALTKEKGRTREEREGEQYFEGIRHIPYAPFVKVCDRLANINYFCSVDSGGDGSRMRETYKGEMHAFLSALITDSDDPRRHIPVEVVIALAEILIYEVDRDEIRRQWGGSNWNLYR